VEAPGFRPSTLSNIELTVGDTVTEIVKLTVSPVAEALSVYTNAVRVQTAKATVSRTMTTPDLDILPQLFRTPVHLANIQPESTSQRLSLAFR